MSKNRDKGPPPENVEKTTLEMPRNTTSKRPRENGKLLVPELNFSDTFKNYV